MENEKFDCGKKKYYYQLIKILAPGGNNYMIIHHIP